MTVTGGRLPARCRRLAGLLAVLLSACFLAGPAVNSARAGSYLVRQCLGADGQGFSGLAGQLGGVSRIEFTPGCRAGQPDTFGLRQDRSGAMLPVGAGGELRWDTPAEARVTALRLDLGLQSANAIEAGIYGVRPAGQLDLAAGIPRDGERRSLDRNLATDPLSGVALRLLCREPAGCANSGGLAAARITLHDAEFKVEDEQPPVIVPAGDLWESAGSGEWRQGSGQLRLAATDHGGGIARVWAAVNGTDRGFGLVICPGALGGRVTSMAPCIDTVNPSGMFSTATAPFREGSNQLRLCAEDFHSGSSTPNRSCSAARTLMVDNVPPAAPVLPRVVGGSGWQADSMFELAWTDPEDHGSPLASVRYRLQHRDTGQVTEKEVPAPGGSRLRSIYVDIPGEYDVELRLRDAAGNLGASAETVLRFDNLPPGDVTPDDPDGWVGADRMPLRQRVERAAPGGPSGVGGYALAVSPEGPVAPCGAGLCLTPPLALTGGVDDRVASLDGLDEGFHWVSAVANSGAGVPSRNTGTTRVNVDLTPPEVSLAGATGSWSSRPVTLTATADDPLSGMAPQPGDPGQPETVIQAGTGAPYRVPGPVATFTIATEGVTPVRYWARDLAGNANDGEIGPGGGRHPAPARATVMIDTVPPTLEFVKERDPGDPERIDLMLADGASGPDRAEIEYRRFGTTDAFVKLPVVDRGEGLFQAWVPSDDLAAGLWEFRATGFDRAGNRESGDRTGDGSPMLLRLPLKQRTVLKSWLEPGHRRGATVPFPGRVRVGGRLLADGSGLPGARLAVTERFEAGSRREQRRRIVRTDGAGRFRLPLGAGPGRRVEVTYAGTKTRSRSAARPVRVKVRARIGLRIRPARLRNGGTVTMTGRVSTRGALPPARGKLVAIQYFDPGRDRWRPVEVLHATRNGRFRFRYRFRTIALAQRIIFRAVALNEAGWPYLRAVSRPWTVTVFPG